MSGSAAAVFSTERAAEVIKAHADAPGPLLPVLHALVAEFGYVDPAAVPIVADVLNVSRADVHGVLTFYHDLRTSPPPRHEVRICRAEACQSVGAEDLVRAAESRLGRSVGDAADDVELHEVFCLGMCSVAPAAQVDGEVVARLDASKVAALLDEVGTRA